MKNINHVGRTYGYYTVLKEAESKKYYSKNRRPCIKRQVECKCICGNIRIVQLGNLYNGATKSCGCKKGELNLLNRKRFTKFPPGAAASKCLYGQYRRGAKSRGLDFQLTLDEFRQITQKECFYCGSIPNQRARYLFSKGPKKGQLRVNGEYVYNGIDRIQNSIGYTKENSRPCCFQCNLAKSTYSEQEFINWIKKVYNYLNIKE